MRHKNLIELDSLVTRFLNQMTNDAYSTGNKFAFRKSWTKGTGVIQDDKGKTSKNY